MRTAIGLIFILSIPATACSAGEARLPDAAVVLDGRMAGAVLHQCSRETPSIGEAAWQPDARQIAEFEAALPRALNADRSPGNPHSNSEMLKLTGDWTKVPSGWRRQYIGLVRNGHRFIYGNFFPERDWAEFRDWRTQPVTVCDGGPAFFGVEYDVEARRFTQFAYNGVA